MTNKERDITQETGYFEANMLDWDNFDDSQIRTMFSSVASRDWGFERYKEGIAEWRKQMAREAVERYNECYIKELRVYEWLDLQSVDLKAIHTNTRGQRKSKMQSIYNWDNKD